MGCPHLLQIMRQPMEWFPFFRLFPYSRTGPVLGKCKFIGRLDMGFSAGKQDNNTVHKIVYNQKGYEGMNVRVYKDAETIGTAAAMLFAACVIEKPHCVLGMATGSSPIPTYKKMAELYRAGVVDYSGVTTYNLDEYVGLDHDHEQSYYYFMMDNLFQHINVKKENIHVLSGVASDPDKECSDYEKAIAAAGGIDLQVLGIGRNGHIAFNEPADSFPQATHIVDLTESTIDANKRFFASADDVPRKALTTGIGSIMKARAIMLIATGADKAEAVKAMVKGPVTPQCPASILQFHPNVTILVDEAAAALL